MSSTKPSIKSSSVLRNQADQKLAHAAYLRQMAEKQRELAVEFEETAKRFEKSADKMIGMADVEDLL